MKSITEYYGTQHQEKGWQHKERGGERGKFTFMHLADVFLSKATYNCIQVIHF